MATKRNHVAKTREGSRKSYEQAQNLGQELEQKFKKAEEEGYVIAKVNANNKASLLKKEYEDQERLFELKISNLQQVLKK